ncbi:MAG TPA: ABC transporter transmembrane domain-containing protein, partial [Vicinamibacteria bacterium]
MTSLAPDLNHIPTSPVAFAMRMSRPFRAWALVAMLAVLVATAASRLMSYVIKLLTDAAIAFGQGRADVDEIWHWALVFPAVYLGNEVVWRTSGFCGMRWITGVVAEANRRLFAHLSEHSATYFSDRYAGALVNKIANAASGT